jgi:ribonuclease VapC
MRLVLDSSAVLALLKPESAKVDLDALVPGQPISAINYSEAADYFSRLGKSRRDIGRLLSSLDLDIVPVDPELALDAAMMRPMTDAAGLSMGDRCCIALAQRLAVPSLTGDRRWADIAAAVDVELVFIR